MKPIPRRHLGFTLIELMIVTVILALLVLVAFPNYREQIARGQRAQAKSVLLQAQQWMEQFYSENYRYDQNLSGTSVTDASLFPSRFSTAPPPGEGAATYNISVTAAARTYTVVATRTGVMASDKCGNFQITNTGRKSVTSFDTSKFANQLDASKTCWQK